MRRVDEILEMAKALSMEQRKELLDELARSVTSPTTWEPTPEERRHALRRFLSMAGTAHSDFTDVSSDKYKHLAEIYADRHEVVDE